MDWLLHASSTKPARIPKALFETIGAFRITTRRPRAPRCAIPAKCTGRVNAHLRRDVDHLSRLVTPRIEHCAISETPVSAQGKTEADTGKAELAPGLSTALR